MSSQIGGEGLFPLYRSIEEIDSFRELVQVVEDVGYVDFF